MVLRQRHLESVSFKPTSCNISMTLTDYRDDGYLEVAVRRHDQVKSRSTKWAQDFSVKSDDFLLNS